MKSLSDYAGKTRRLGWWRFSTSRFLIKGARAWPSVFARTSLGLQIAFLLLTACFARERGPRVEVVCPSPPIPVPIDKNKVLVYELHVTNFDTVPLTLKRVEIYANEESNEPLIALEGDKLSAAIIHVGAAMMMSSASPRAAQNPRTIDPSGRNVVFLWIELPINRTVPASLKHRMIFSSTPEGASNPSDATLEDFQLPVSQDAVPRLSPPFRGGIWLAGDGPMNNSNHRRSIFAIDGHIYSPERFAIDWIKVGPSGDSRHDGTHFGYPPKLAEPADLVGVHPAHLRLSFHSILAAPSAFSHASTTVT
jgi:hypothetical protein